MLFQMVNEMLQSGNNPFEGLKPPMPVISTLQNLNEFDGRQSETAMAIRRGILRGMAETDMVFLPELTLSGGRRADLVGLDRKGMVIVIEIKSSVADFQVDKKWHEYKDFCDRFYFATHPDVPSHIFPEDEGFILADEHGCEIIREAQAGKLKPATRKALTLRFARSAALRTKRLTLHEQFTEPQED